MIFHNFQNCKKKDNKHNSLNLGMNIYINNSLQLAQKYAWIFVRGHYLFREAHSYEEQIMSKDKYLSIFSTQIEAIVFIILQIFFATCAVLKIGDI